MEGVAHHLGNAGRVVDLCGPLAQGCEHLPTVHLLEGLAVELAARDLPDEQDHRRRVLERGVDAEARVGGARSAGREADAGPAGELAIGVGHVGRAALLAAGDQSDLLAGVVEGIEGGQVALAGHGEGHVDTVDLQRVDENPPARS